METRENGIRRFKRDWIQKDEGHLTYVQFFGFVLITLGVIYFISFPVFCAFKVKEICGSDEVAIIFFTTMLGVAFAFPDMLKGQSNEMSTMRITVFMLTNVICMLLLKIGWGAKSLTDIGLDGSWVGVIAFLFGAKAAQSYFENADKVKSKIIGNDNPGHTDSSNDGTSGISQIAIAQLAKVQNENKLKSANSNIVSVSDTLVNGKSCLTIYVDGQDISDIPETIPAEINEKTFINVPVRIISNSGPAKPHISQKRDEIQDSLPGSGLGSFCCLAQHKNGTTGLVTAGHNFTGSTFEDLGGYQYDDKKRNVYLNGALVGSLLYQKMDFVQDLAIVEIAKNPDLMDGYTSFGNKYYEVSRADILPTPNAVIESRPNKARKGPNVRSVYILDCNINYDVTYNGENYPMINVILLGDSPDLETCKQVSIPGDSGSCVYHAGPDGNKLIGILIGGNGKFSVVLPIKQIMNKNNFKIL